MKIKEKETKSIITKSKLPGADFVINPYVGCEHRCIYCYADFMKRFTGHQGEEWGSFVDVKSNAPDTIRISRIKPGEKILVGSVTDPYQPIEKEYQVTRKCLEKLLEAQPNIEILTKSSLILRDIDLLKQFKNLEVGISLGVLDDGLARKLEPCASLPSERIETLKRLSKEGISTYIFVSPIFPEISDVEGIIDQTKDYASQIMFENLNIRGNNKERIMSFIRENKPELIPTYESVDRNYWEGVRKKIEAYCKKQGVTPKIYFYHNEIRKK